MSVSLENIMKHNTEHREDPGFTLVELVLAVFIFSFVIGILSTSLTFTLRVWQKQQNQAPPEMPNILDLMKWQLANFDAVPIRFEGESRYLLEGNEYSLTFTTDRSIKAISKGVPVVARYVYKSKEKKLYYSEFLLDPYHPEAIQKFMKAEPGHGEEWPRFYPIDVESLLFSYIESQEHPEYKGSWENHSEIPSGVLVKWSLRGESAASSNSQIMIPNSLFPKTKEAMQKALATSGSGLRQ
jgi:prepilin-type N-terminal cleavage/methylation domain-containing protein